MSLLDLYYLKDNPFTLVPPSEHMIWADRKKFREELEQAIKFSLSTTPSQIIACIWSDWGSGKTHAMRFFSKPETLLQLSKDAGFPVDKEPLAIPMIFPINNVLHSIYLEIIYKNLMPYIKNAVKVLARQTAIEKEGVLENRLGRIVDSNLARVLAQFGFKNKEFLVERYLTLETKSADLNKLSVAKNIETTTEQLDTLAQIFVLLTSIIASRIFLWIDDLERISEVAGRDMFEFQYFLRDILDKVPNNLTIIFNITKYPGEEITDRIKYLGPAVLERISKIIPIDYFSYEDYLGYIKDLLKEYRVQDKSEYAKIPWFPFEESCLQYIFDVLRAKPTNLHPRTVNKVLTSVLQWGLKEETKPITKGFIEKHRDDLSIAAIS